MRRLLLSWVWLIRELGDPAQSAKLSLRPSSPAPLRPDGHVCDIVRANPGLWLGCENPSFVTAVERAAALDLADAAAALATAVYSSGAGLRGVLESFLLAHASAVEAARRCGDRAAEAVLLTQLGQLCFNRDRYAESEQHLSEALGIFQELGDRHGEAVTLAAMASTLRLQGRVDDALHSVRRAHAYFTTAARSDPAVGFTVGTLGLIEIDHGDFIGARVNLEEAVVVNRRLGSRRGEAMSFWGLCMLHRALGNLDESLDSGRVACEIARSIGYELGEALFGQAVAKTLLRLGRGDRALPVLTSALATCRRLGERWGEALVLRTRGELHLAVGRFAEAEADLGHARDMFIDIDARLMRARTERDLADLRDAQGDHAAALILRRDALATFALLGARDHRELLPRVKPVDALPRQRGARRRPEPARAAGLEQNL